MTPSQRKHAQKAEALQEQAAKRIDATKSGHSASGAERLTEANKERMKAGLIKGKMDK